MVNMVWFLYSSIYFSSFLSIQHLNKRNRLSKLVFISEMFVIWMSRKNPILFRWLEGRAATFIFLQRYSTLSLSMPSEKIGFEVSRFDPDLWEQEKYSNNWSVEILTANSEYVVLVPDQKMFWSKDINNEFFQSGMQSYSCFHPYGVW